jgi:uncharacterized protein (TIGR03086 family)
MAAVLQETWPEGGQFRCHGVDMTNEATTITTLQPTDPRFLFAHAVVTARATVDGVRPDQMELPTPCPDYDVRTLLGHMAIVFMRIAALGNGEDPMAMPDHVEGVADDAWPATFLQAAHDVRAAWADDAKLGHLMSLPWVTAPGAAMVAMYTSELTVHTWDLAVATGQHPAWYAPTVDAALTTALMALPTGDREAYFAAMAADMPEIAGRPPFRNPVATDDAANALDRLVGWYGRQPSSAA